MTGGGVSERSDQVEELAEVCASSGGMMEFICGESKSISPSERARFSEGLAAQGDEARVTDVESDKIRTSSSLLESRSPSSEVASKGLCVRGI